MDFIQDLKIGEKLEIQPVVGENSKSLKHKITSQLIDIKNEVLYVSNPIRSGVSYPLHKNEKIKVIFYRDDKGIYSFIAEVIQRLSTNFPVYKIKPLSEPEKIQRRYYYRLQILTKVLVKNLNEDTWTETLTKDLSGGGFRVVSSKKFDEGEILECNIKLDKDKEVNVACEVIRVVKNFETNEYDISMKYVDISEATRNEIIAFIFKKQRELRQKGLI
mgnify:CR=1 FL=1